MSASPRRCCCTKRVGSAVAEPTLYLFDGFNLLHAGGFDSPEELRDLLASWVAAKGARGVLVFDGQGADSEHGPLLVRWAATGWLAPRFFRIVSGNQLPRFAATKEINQDVVILHASCLVGYHAFEHA